MCFEMARALPRCPYGSLESRRDLANRTMWLPDNQGICFSIVLASSQQIPGVVGRLLRAQGGQCLRRYHSTWV